MQQEWKFVYHAAFSSHLSKLGLNPIRLACNPSHPDGRHKSTGTTDGWKRKMVEKMSDDCRKLVGIACTTIFGDLVVRRTRLQLGNRAFRVAGPVAWNSLPLDIRLAHTLSTFEIMLKTHLFSRSYFSEWLFRRVRAANIVRRPCSDSSHVTAPYKLSFHYYFFKPSVDMFPREFKN